MKQIFALSVLALVVAVAAGVALASRSGGPGHGQMKHGAAIAVVERATTDAVTNPPGVQTRWATS